MISPNADRHIHTRFGPRQVVDLLQTVFAAELIAPSSSLWIVSPWISDIAILDNSTNAFSTLAGDWARSRVPLSIVLGHLLRRGTTIRIAARPIEHNDAFFAALLQQAGDGGARLRVEKTDTLHEKGILGDGFYLSGSMNITHNGISFNDEVLHFFTNPETVAANRHLFFQWWGAEVEG
jgi:phosphatidylserine/phosphatidylglycerophosphate/cardiolipin synthase-like enzyme